MIDWNGEKITIRPSSVDGFTTCPYQWASVFIGGEVTIPNARAAIGTAIHKGVEEMWKEAMVLKKKEPNISMMEDAAVTAFTEEDLEQDLRYDSGENMNTAHGEIRGGIRAFVEDIVPFTDIPEGVEKRFSIALNHKMVAEVAGTLDYLKPDTVADVKTSKKKPVPTNYKTQQSIYKLLAQANGYDIQYNLIQGVVLKTQPQGHILTLEPDVDQAKFFINMILDTLDVFYKDIVPAEVLFRPNTKHYLCTPKYCSKYGKTCPATGGTPKK